MLKIFRSKFLARCLQPAKARPKSRRSFAIEALEQRDVPTVSLLGSFSGGMTNGYNGSTSYLSVIASFSVDDNNTTDIMADDSLLIRLKNVGQAAHDRSDVLSTLFFDVAGTPTLTPLSALVPSLSNILNGGTGNVGAEWHFKAGNGFTPDAGAAYSQHYGISTTGLGIFGSQDTTFAGGNIAGSQDGAPTYGVVNGIATNANAQLIGNNRNAPLPVVSNQIDFVLKGYTGGAISNVTFQFGTSGNEARINTTGSTTGVTSVNAVGVSSVNSKEGEAASYEFIATLDKPSVGVTIVTLSNGSTIAIANGQTSGSVSIVSGNNDDYYIDPSSMTVSISGVSSSSGAKVNFDSSVKATSVVEDTTDTTTVNLGASEEYEGANAKYTFTATLSNPSQGVTTVITDQGTITIADGKTTGTLEIASGNGEDVYKDPSSLTATITITSGGNFENLVLGSTTSATARILDTIDTTYVQLTGEAKWEDYDADGDKEGGYHLTASLTNAPATAVTITLTTGQTITIPSGQKTGDLVIQSKDKKVSIASYSGGNFEALEASSSDVKAPVGNLAVHTFNDQDADFIKDVGEPSLGGETVMVTYDSWEHGEGYEMKVTTNDNGKAFILLDAVFGTGYIMESLPSLNTGWSQTIASATGTLQKDGPEVSPNLGFHFGEINQAGKTIGFWSNKNGAKFLDSNGDGKIDTGVLNMLKGLNLVNGDGTFFNMSGSVSVTTFQKWLNASSAKNMANMLSAQLAGTALNVFFNNVDDEMYVRIDMLTYGGNTLSAGMLEQLNLHEVGSSTLQVVKVSDLIAAASAELAIIGHNQSFASGSFRVYQEALKNIFDAINNNQQIFTW